MKYTKFIDEMHAYIQSEEVEEKPNLQLAETPNMHFINIQKRTLREKWQLMKSIADYDFILIRVPSKLGLVMGLVASIKRKKYAVEVVGNFYEALILHGSLRNKLFAIPAHLAMKWLVKRSSATVYVTQKYLQAVYPSNGKKFSIPNAIIQKRAFKEEKPTIYTIGMIGAVNVLYKGHHILFEALRLLDKLNTPINITLLGEGQLNELPHYKNIKVSHLGLLSGDDVERWFSNLSLYIQPSLTEATPRSVMEAMSFSLPVIASRVGGIPELIDEKALVNKDDAGDLALRIESFITDTELSKQQAYRNYEFIQSFDISTNESLRKDMMNYIEKLTIEAKRK